MSIGFIGLGIMGKPMAKNVLAAGHALVVGSHHAGAAAELVALGATSAATPREIAEQVDVVVTMLPDSPQVTEVALGPAGISDGARPGLVYVDMSSIAPSTAKEVAQALSERGVSMLDAPVSGGEPKAIDGTLSIMVGGERATLDRVRGVLGAIGSSVVHVGDVGAGNTAKLANQVVVALNLAAVSEAFHAGAAGGSLTCRGPRGHPRRTRREHGPRGEGADDAGPHVRPGLPSRPPTSRTSSTRWRPHARSAHGSR